jgi:hypothetical protein
VAFEPCSSRPKLCSVSLDGIADAPVSDAFALNAAEMM